MRTLVYLRTRRPGVRISQGATLILLESDSCNEMNIGVFRSFPSIPSNNRLSENFFDRITKPKPTQLSVTQIGDLPRQSPPVERTASGSSTRFFIPLPKLT